MHLLRIAEIRGREFLPVDTFAVPHRNAVSPPQLTADAPILNVVEPVQVDLRPTLRIEFDMAVAHRRLGLLDFRISQPPLHRQARFDRHVGALGVPDIVLVGLLLDQCAGGFKQLRCLLAPGKPVQAREFRSGEFIQHAVRVEHIADRQLVTLPDFKVRLVMRRGDLERTGAEFPIHRSVGNDRNLLAHQGTPDGLANQPRVARIIRMHGNGGVTGNRLRPGGDDFDKLSRASGNLIPHAVEQPLHGLHDHLFVGKGGE